MKINNAMDRWNILDYAKTNAVQEHKYIKDVVPELKNQQIKMDSVMDTCSTKHQIVQQNIREQCKSL